MPVHAIHSGKKHLQPAYQWQQLKDIKFRRRTRFCSIQVKSLNDQSVQCFRQRPITPNLWVWSTRRLLILVHKYLGYLVLLAGACLFIWWCFWGTHTAARLWSYKNTIYLPVPPCHFPSTFSLLCFQLLLSQSRKWENIACKFNPHYKQTAHTQTGQVHTSSLTQSCDPHVEIHHSNI